MQSDQVAGVQTPTISATSSPQIVRKGRGHAQTGAAESSGVSAARNAAAPASAVSTDNAPNKGRQAGAAAKALTASAAVPFAASARAPAGPSGLKQARPQGKAGLGQPAGTAHVRDPGQGQAQGHKGNVGAPAGKTQARHTGSQAGADGAGAAVKQRKLNAAKAGAAAGQTRAEPSGESHPSAAAAAGDVAAQPPALAQPPAVRIQRIDPAAPWGELPTSVQLGAVLRGSGLVLPQEYARLLEQQRQKPAGSSSTGAQSPHLDRGGLTADIAAASPAEAAPGAVLETPTGDPAAPVPTHADDATGDQESGAASAADGSATTAAEQAPALASSPSAAAEPAAAPSPVAAPQAEQPKPSHGASVHVAEPGPMSLPELNRLSERWRNGLKVATSVMTLHAVPAAPALAAAGVEGRTTAAAKGAATAAAAGATVAGNAVTDAPKAPKGRGARQFHAAASTHADQEEAAAAKQGYSATAGRGTGPAAAVAVPEPGPVSIPATPSAIAAVPMAVQALRNGLVLLYCAMLSRMADDESRGTAASAGVGGRGQAGKGQGKTKAKVDQASSGHVPSPSHGHVHGHAVQPVDRIAARLASLVTEESGLHVSAVRTASAALQAQARANAEELARQANGQAESSGAGASDPAAASADSIAAASASSSAQPGTKGIKGKPAAGAAAGAQAAGADGQATPKIVLLRKPAPATTAQARGAGQTAAAGPGETPDAGPAAEGTTSAVPAPATTASAASTSAAPSGAQLLLLRAQAVRIACDSALRHVQGRLGMLEDPVRRYSAVNPSSTADAGSNGLSTAQRGVVSCLVVATVALLNQRSEALGASSAGQDQAVNVAALHVHTAEIAHGRLVSSLALLPSPRVALQTTIIQLFLSLTGGEASRAAAAARSGVNVSELASHGSVPGLLTPGYLSLLSFSGQVKYALYGKGTVAAAVPGVSAAAAAGAGAAQGHGRSSAKAPAHGAAPSNTATVAGTAIPAYTRSGLQGLDSRSALFLGSQLQASAIRLGEVLRRNDTLWSSCHTDELPRHVVAEAGPSRTEKGGAADPVTAALHKVVHVVELGQSGFLRAPVPSEAGRASHGFEARMPLFRIILRILSAGLQGAVLPGLRVVMASVKGQGSPSVIAETHGASPATTAGSDVAFQGSSTQQAQAQARIRNYSAIAACLETMQAATTLALVHADRLVRKASMELSVGTGEFGGQGTGSSSSTSEDDEDEARQAVSPGQAKLHAVGELSTSLLRTVASLSEIGDLCLCLLPKVHEATAAATAADAAAAAAHKAEAHGAAGLFKKGAAVAVAPAPTAHLLHPISSSLHRTVRLVTGLQLGLASMLLRSHELATSDELDGDGDSPVASGDAAHGGASAPLNPEEDDGADATGRSGSAKATGTLPQSLSALWLAPALAAIQWYASRAAAVPSPSVLAAPAALASFLRQLAVSLNSGPLAGGPDSGSSVSSGVGGKKGSGGKEGKSPRHTGPVTDDNTLAAAVLGYPLFDGSAASNGKRSGPSAQAVRLCQLATSLGGLLSSGTSRAKDHKPAGKDQGTALPSIRYVPAAASAQQPSGDGASSADSAGQAQAQPQGYWTVDVPPGLLPPQAATAAATQPSIPAKTGKGAKRCRVCRTPIAVSDSTGSGGAAAEATTCGFCGTPLADAGAGAAGADGDGADDGSDAASVATHQQLSDDDEADGASSTGPGLAGATGKGKDSRDDDGGALPPPMVYKPSWKLTPAEHKTLWAAAKVAAGTGAGACGKSGDDDDEGNGQETRAGQEDYDRSAVKLRALRPPAVPATSSAGKAAGAAATGAGGPLAAARKGGVLGPGLLQLPTAPSKGAPAGGRKGDRSGAGAGPTAKDTGAPAGSAKAAAAAVIPPARGITIADVLEARLQAEPPTATSSAAVVASAAAPSVAGVAAAGPATEPAAVAAAPDAEPAQAAPAVRAIAAAPTPAQPALLKPSAAIRPSAGRLVGPAATPPPFVEKVRTCKARTVAIDGLNVAMRAGNGSQFIAAGIARCAAYWQSKGMRVLCFVPDSLVDETKVTSLQRAAAAGQTVNPTRLPDNLALLLELQAKNVIVPCPAQDYDDSYTLRWAQRHVGTLICSNDRYRDWLSKVPERHKNAARAWLKSHVISFVFVGSASRSDGPAGAGTGAVKGGTTAAGDTATAKTNTSTKVSLEFLPNPDFIIPGDTKAVDSTGAVAYKLDASGVATGNVWAALGHDTDIDYRSFIRDYMVKIEGYAPPVDPALLAARDKAEKSAAAAQTLQAVILKQEAAARVAGAAAGGAAGQAGGGATPGRGAGAAQTSGNGQVEVAGLNKDADIYRPTLLQRLRPSDKVTGPGGAAGASGTAGAGTAAGSLPPLTSADIDRIAAAAAQAALAAFGASGFPGFGSPGLGLGLGLGLGMGQGVSGGFGMGGMAGMPGPGLFGLGPQGGYSQGLGLGGFSQAPGMYAGDASAGVEAQYQGQQQQLEQQPQQAGSLLGLSQGSGPMDGNGQPASNADGNNMAALSLQLQQLQLQAQAQAQHQALLLQQAYAQARSAAHGTLPGTGPGQATAGLEASGDGTAPEGQGQAVAGSGASDVQSPFSPLAGGSAALASESGETVWAPGQGQGTATMQATAASFSGAAGFAAAGGDASQWNASAAPWQGAAGGAGLDGSAAPWAGGYAGFSSPFEASTPFAGISGVSMPGGLSGINGIGTMGSMGQGMAGQGMGMGGGMGFGTSMDLQGVGFNPMSMAMGSMGGMGPYPFGSWSSPMADGQAQAQAQAQGLSAGMGMGVGGYGQGYGGQDQFGLYGVSYGGQGQGQAVDAGNAGAGMASAAGAGQAQAGAPGHRTAKPGRAAGGKGARGQAGGTLDPRLLSDVFALALADDDEASGDEDDDEDEEDEGGAESGPGPSTATAGATTVGPAPGVAAPAAGGSSSKMLQRLAAVPSIW